MSQVERGVVSFVEKARHAQAAGAACVLVINSEDADYMPLGMQSDPGDEIQPNRDSNTTTQQERSPHEKRCRIEQTRV